MGNTLIASLLSIVGWLVVLAYGYYSLDEAKKLVREEAEKKAAARDGTRNLIQPNRFDLRTIFVPPETR